MKDVFVRMRATREERDFITRLAASRGYNVSDYLRHLITMDQIKEGNNNE